MKSKVEVYVFGIVFPKRLKDWNGRGFRKDADGRDRWFPFIKNVEGDEYRVFPDEIMTPGLLALRFGQVVKFKPDHTKMGPVARDIRRIVAANRKIWEDFKGRPGEVVSEREIRLDGGTTVCVKRGVTRIVKRHLDDIVGFVEGDEVLVTLSPDGITVAELIFDE